MRLDGLPKRAMPHQLRAQDVSVAYRAPPHALVLCVTTRTLYYDTAKGHRHHVDMPPRPECEFDRWPIRTLALFAGQTYAEIVAASLNRPLFILGMTPRNIVEMPDSGDSKDDPDDMLA